MIKQTGNIPCYPMPEDYILGGETAVTTAVRVPNGDWTAYLPSTEKQSTILFDTMSCTSFSLCNLIETQLNYLIRHNQIPQEKVTWLKEKGYIVDGLANLSDRWIAVKSNTTKNGNDFRTVVETARKVGFIPESIFPFEGITFDQYHNKAKITADMEALGKEFINNFDLKWNWVFFDQDPKMAQEALNASKQAIQTSPIQIGIPIPATHATSLVALNGTTAKVFDTYDPFLFEQSVDSWKIHYALAPVLTVKEAQPKVLYPNVVFKTMIKFGMKGDMVKLWQQFLIAEGLLAANLDTGNFFDKTLMATRNFQMRHGIEPVGQVGPKTRAKANEIISKKALGK